MIVSLVKPPEVGLLDQRAYPPLGLLYLAAGLDQAKISVKLSFMESDNDLIRGGDIYGISVHSPGVYSSVVPLIKKLKGRGKPICVGGAFPTSAPEYFTDLGVHIFKGEADITFPQAITAGKLNGPPRVFECERPTDLDALPFPLRRLLPIHVHRYNGDTHHSKGKMSTTILPTRGCPYRCSFCDRNIMGTKYRRRSIENIKEELSQLASEGFKWFRIPDDNLMVNKEWFDLFVNMIGQFKVEWTCLARSDSLTIQTAIKMKDAGCREIFLGVESGSQRILDLMHKRTTVRDHLNAINICRTVGIKSCAYMLFGFPGEDSSSVLETIDFLNTASPDKSRISQFLPVPGSDVYNNPSKYGIKIKFNPDTFWYFDNHDFCVEYPNQAEMLTLRDTIMAYYNSRGYQSGWK